MLCVSHSLRPKFITSRQCFVMYQLAKILHSIFVEVKQTTAAHLAFFCRRKRRKETRKKVLEDGTEVEVEVEVDEEGNEVEGKVVSILDALDKK